MGGAPPLRSIGDATVPHFLPLCNTIPHFSVRSMSQRASADRAFLALQSGKSTRWTRWDGCARNPRFCVQKPHLNANLRAEAGSGGSRSAACSRLERQGIGAAVEQRRCQRRRHEQQHGRHQQQRHHELDLRAGPRGVLPDPAGEREAGGARLRLERVSERGAVAGGTVEGRRRRRGSRAAAAGRRARRARVPAGRRAPPRPRPRAHSAGERALGALPDRERRRRATRPPRSSRGGCRGARAGRGGPAGRARPRSGGATGRARGSPAAGASGATTMPSRPGARAASGTAATPPSSAAATFAAITSRTPSPAGLPAASIRARRSAGARPGRSGPPTRRRSLSPRPGPWDAVGQARQDEHVRPLPAAAATNASAPDVTTGPARAGSSSTAATAWRTSAIPTSHAVRNELHRPANQPGLASSASSAPPSSPVPAGSPACGARS